MIGDELIDALLEAPPGQMDAHAKERLAGLRGLSEDESKTLLLEILDEAAFTSSASDFVMRVLYSLWFSCGGTMEELTRPRESPAKRLRDVDCRNEHELAE